jgi:uncharacterized protein (DUF1501 family)
MRRRRFLETLAAAPLALALPRHARAAAPSRLLVLVYLHGGNDGYNAWVPYTDPLYYRMRPNLAVTRDAVLKITDRQGFHPALSPLLPLWERKELALVQGIGLPDITQQHYRDSEMAFTGADDGEYPVEGWASRALGRIATPPDALADAVAFDLLDIRDGDPMGPFRGDKRRVVQVHHPKELLEKRRFSDCVIELNAPAKARLAGGGDTLAASTLKTAFPTDQFGAAVRAAVELAASDRAVPVIHIALNGHDGDKHHSVDTHWEQLKWQADAFTRLANGLAALRSGLVEIGRWDETLVLTYDEFGRSPRENESQGTHHGWGTTHFALGGRVKGGLLGIAPPVVHVHQIGGPEPVIDTRSLWTTVVERWWGADAGGIFTRRHASLDLLRG